LEGSPLEPVRVPEREANILVKELRHHRELAGLGVSVYAFVTKTGNPALHIAADHSLGNGEYDRYDLYYKAHTETAVMVKNAVKRIKAKFGL
jgi:hypothetical protein